jgi:hypothetical protein
VIELDNGVDPVEEFFFDEWYEVSAGVYHLEYHNYQYFTATYATSDSADHFLKYQANGWAYGGSARQSGALPRAEWAMQVRNVLNKMVWTMQRKVSRFTWTSTINRRYGRDYGYTAAVAAWDAAAWNTSGVTTSIHFAQQYISGGSETEWISCYRFRTDTYLTGWATDFKHTVDGYLQFERKGGAVYSDPDYSTVDPGAGNWRFEKMYERSTPFDDADDTVMIGDFSSITITDPGAGSSAGWDITRGYPDYSEDVSPWTLVNKWNVTDGFAYT